MLFLMALCIGESFRSWKKILALITAFAIGHSLTLVLSGMKIVAVNVELVEFLIPITIMLTALTRGFLTEKQNSWGLYMIAFEAFFFGLIHGLGFSNYFNMLTSGVEDSIVRPLMGFTGGIEIGQIVVVGLLLSVSYLFTKAMKMPNEKWSLLQVGFVVGVALMLMIG